MIHIGKHEKEKCCGCNACEQICPTNCIDMLEDIEGFRYPRVDESKCIHCGKCNKSCPILQVDTNQVQFLDSALPRVYGGWNLDEEIRHESSSGGVFSLFANYVLDKGGVVFGATLLDDLSVEHTKISNKEELACLRGSKYVQSNIMSTYKETRDALKDGRFVLFTGTPCQVGGLKTFLNKEYDNLYTCDFICHGVPSPEIFRRYVNYLEEAYNDKVTHVQFRTKHKGWRQFGQMGTVISFENREPVEFMPAYKDSYMNGFLSDIYLRPSCYDCRFKAKHKTYVDITFADFWGVKRHYPDLYDNKGTSLMLVHTLKGKDLFNSVKEQMYYEQCDFDKALKSNPCLWKSVTLVKNRKLFFYALEVEPFEEVMKKYMTASAWVTQKILMKLGRR